LATTASKYTLAIATARSIIITAYWVTKRSAMRSRSAPVRPSSIKSCLLSA
jgi:hypothetical protein